MGFRKWRWAIVAAAVVVAVGAGAVALKGAGKSGGEQAKKDRPPLEFAAADIVRLTPMPLAPELALPGTVTAVSQATVRSKLSAEVRRVAVREGDRVSPGQVLAEFDTSTLRVLLAERTAALESARAQLVQNERTRQANAQLVKQNFISQNAFDTADAAYRAQAAAVEAAAAQLEQTRLLLNDAVVRAPIGGLVSRRHVQPGEKVGLDAPLVSIVDLAQLEVAAQAPVGDVGQIRVGSTAEVEIEGMSGKSYRGRVERINPSAEPGTRAINVYVALGNEDAQLRAGMFARVRLALGAGAPVPTLPMSAIRTDNGQAAVWVIADGKLSRRAVELGRRDERAQRVEILGGLAPTDEVVATRFDSLREGLSAKVISGAGEGPSLAGGGGAPRL